jgi:hypothetical protein
VSIAYSDLKDKRARKTVVVACGGTLADYVPFYFAPRSPMLYLNWQGYVPAHAGSQDQIVHLVCSVQAVAKPQRFVITNMHPIAALAEQFDDLEALDGLDWTTMRAKYWSDTDEQPDRRSRRQAEFLVHRSVPVREVRLVGVMTARMACEASRVLDAMDKPPPVAVRKDWYY